MKLTIDVTQSDIERGERGSISNSPIGLAIERETGKRCLLGAHSGAIGFEHNFYLPRVAINWRNDFDLGELVEPLEFEIEVDGELVK